MLCCCFYTKIREFTLVFFAFGAPLLTAVIEAVTVPFEPFAGLYIFSAAIYIPTITDLVLCFISTVILSVWFCTLRKHRILRGKAKLMCKQIILIIVRIASSVLSTMDAPSSSISSSYTTAFFACCLGCVYLLPASYHSSAVLCVHLWECLQDETKQSVCSAESPS